MNNIIISMSQFINKSELFWNTLILFPDCTSLVCLLAGICGMFQGIEVCHPIYAVLFTNLVSALLSTILNLVLFTNLEIETYVRFANASNGWYLVFHCNAWCITSILRYLYILHSDWVDQNFPSQKKLAKLTVVITFLSYVVLISPMIAISINLGKFYMSIFLYLQTWFSEVLQKVSTAIN